MSTNPTIAPAFQGSSPQGSREAAGSLSSLTWLPGQQQQAPQSSRAVIILQDVLLTCDRTDSLMQKSQKLQTDSCL